MQTLSASDARASLYRLIDETAMHHQPVIITGKRNNAILISESDWAAIQETLFLLAVPQMRESIQLGLHTPIEDCIKELDW
ncbi:MAG: type II toxin-antitoxin system Phd/YefM family antitoxin [Moraxellaceae bacterium]|jgi:antitoxin YefM|nr:type II toxin-antitoxin system Phd/YefM family antitoxin [Moraxellaceae bacterium]MBL0231811.1 type II toxin-antitoxin system Phd/YefM family antitoxin [Moraxellaceae bacterium]